MRNDSADIAEKFEENKIRIIERVYFYFLTMNIITSFISRSRTSYPSGQETRILFATFGLFAGLIAVLLMTKYLIKSVKVKIYLYSLMGISYTVVMHYLFADKAFVTLHGIVLVLYTIPSIMNRLRYVLYFSLVPMMISLYYFINPPKQSIQVGKAFYFNTLLTFVMLTYLLYQLVKQNKWYEGQIEDRVVTTESQNLELTALNEEYIAAENELFNKYDELYNLNNELGLTTKKLSTILNLTHEAYIEVNTESLKISFNRMAKEIFSFADDEVRIETILEQFNEIDSSKLKKSFYDIKNDLVMQNETQVSYFNMGVKNYYSFIMTKFIENKVEYILIAGKDITLEKERERSLYQAAYVDSLTGLMNKQALYKQVDKRLESNNKSFSMYILDLKGMKDINAMFGFKIGDRVIKSVGSNLRRILDGECILARTGGDEFAFIVDDLTKPRQLNDLIAVKLDRYIDDNMNFRINYKLGVAYMKDAKDSMELYENAEMAMYMAKENIIEDVTIYKKEYREEAEKSIKLSHELENALINNEIYLNFQPKVNSQTGKIVSYEALVRWNSKVLGFISPIDFIEVAEQTGSIIVLGRFIIEESCKFARKAILKDPDIIVSINISSVQLRKYDFESELLKIIDRYQIPSRNIGIEITETAIIFNLERAKAILNRLRKLGITVFLDDFGTGYSSLSHLSILPIDVLKIDKSFIDHIEKDAKQRNLVKHIITLAKSMGLKVVAEGVEVEEQFEILKSYKCEIIQGYYFYRPLGYVEALELL